MSFETTLQVIGMEVQATPDESRVDLVIMPGIMIPVGPEQVIPVPAGLYRVPMGKAAALKHGQELLDAAEAMPDPKPDSGLVVANNLTAVEKAAQQARKLRGE